MSKGLMDPAFWKAVNERASEHGLLGPYVQSLNQFAGLMSGAVTPQEFGAIKSQQLHDQFNSPEGMMNFMPFAGLTAWHGSPHKFDKFRMDKIGTGEGAQAYGHGLYFAESPEVARAYQNALSKYGEIRFKDGSKVSVPDLPYNSPEQIAGNIWMQHPEVGKAKFALGNLDPKYLGAPREVVAKELDRLHERGASLSGSMYKVDIADSAIPKMLDWDAPLSKQPESVRRALTNSGIVDLERNIGPSPTGVVRDMGWTKNVSSLTGDEIYKRLVEARFNQGKSVTAASRKLAEREAAEYLRSIGVPGIKYRDGMSRGKDAGTHNYVLFDEDLVKILERQ